MAQCPQLEHSRSPFRTEPRGQWERAAGFLTRNSSLNKLTVYPVNSETAAGGEGRVEPWFGFTDDISVSDTSGHRTRKPVAVYEFGGFIRPQIVKLLPDQLPWSIF